MHAESAALEGHRLGMNENADTPAGAAIEVDDLSVTYVGMDGAHVQALAPTSFAIADREFVSLVGPSGCGKTTLLNAIGDLLRPSTGTVTIAGRPAAELRRAQQIGMVFQDSVLLPWRSVHDNIRFLSDVAKRPLSREAIEDLGRLVGLERFLTKYPHELSGGMRQRASIARALALDPQLLLMDEPFGALDEITRQKMNLELLRIWSERRKTVVFVTHSLSEAAFLSDRVIVMGKGPGRVVADVRIDLPRPRTADTRFASEMRDYIVTLNEHLESGDRAEAA
jgi:NitT/TauT family transport system ATP-binding protein